MTNGWIQGFPYERKNHPIYGKALLSMDADLLEPESHGLARAHQERLARVLRLVESCHPIAYVINPTGCKPPDQWLFRP